MAPPFNINNGSPIVSDLISAFPVNEQANRTTIEDWLTWLSDATTGFLKAQAMNPPLAALNPLTPAADKMAYYTGASAAAMTDLTAFARTLLDDANATAALTTLGAASTASVTTVSTDLATSRTKSVQEFTASGTWTKPAGCQYVVVEAIGGGGGGGGTSGGGGSASGSGGTSGFYGFTNFINVTAIASGAVTIGAAGTGVSASNGTQGGNTSIVLGATTYTWGGGPGGVAGAHAAGVRMSQAGGSGTGTNVKGSSNRAGVPGMTSHSDNFGQGGYGSDSPFGTGGAPSRFTSANDANGGAAGATNYGAGGSGGVSVATTNSTTGGSGAPGFMRIWEFY